MHAFHQCPLGTRVRALIAARTSHRCTIDLDVQLTPYLGQVTDMIRHGSPKAGIGIEIENRELGDETDLWGHGSPQAIVPQIDASDESVVGVTGDSVPVAFWHALALPSRAVGPGLMASR